MAWWSMCQMTHSGRKPIKLSECARWPVCLLCLAFNIYIMRKLLNLLIYILKDIYSRLAFTTGSDLVETA